MSRCLRVQLREEESAASQRGEPSRVASPCRRTKFNAILSRSLLLVARTTDSSDMQRSVSAMKAVPDGKEEFVAYTDYNKVLRSWFVAFGVGGPALFLINDQNRQRLKDAGDLRWVAAL